eukprot:scaffold104050_cov57-Phaeocystis_antarctica.AAC.3
MATADAGRIVQPSASMLRAEALPRSVRPGLLRALFAKWLDGDVGRQQRPKFNLSGTEERVSHPQGIACYKRNSKKRCVVNYHQALASTSCYRFRHH